MLQAFLGDSVFLRGLHLYYGENRLRHVALPDLERAMEEASGSSLRWFFDEWFRSNDRLDYGIGSARVTRLADGRYRTRVQVVRRGDAWMPVTLQVDDVRRTLTSHSRRQTVEFVTADRPARAVLDPDGVILDYRRGNDSRKL
jgi:aminopeptidase N